jgi:hypothetical protein
MIPDSDELGSQHAHVRHKRHEACLAPQREMLNDPPQTPQVCYLTGERPTSAAG